MPNPILDDIDEDLLPREEEDTDPDNLDLAALPEKGEVGDEGGESPPDSEAPIIGEAPPALNSPVGGLPATGSGVVPPAGPVPPSAQDKLSALYAKMPQVFQRANPKWYQKLGAAAIGGAAGWNNANPKARPIDPSGAIQGILYPGQERKEAQFGVELGAAQREAELERQKKKDDAQQSELGARTEAERARGKYYQDVGDARTKQALDKGKTPLEKYTNLMAIPGMTTDNAISLATTGKMAVAAKAPAGMAQVTKEVGEKLGIVPNQNGEYWAPSSAVGANLRVDNTPDRTPKSAEERLNQIDADPDLSATEKRRLKNEVIGDYRSMHPHENAGDKPASKAAFKEIEERHQGAYRDLSREKAERAIPGSSKGRPMTPDEEVQRKQQIEDAYAAEIRAAGGQATAVQHPRPAQSAGQKSAAGQDVRTFGGHPYAFDSTKSKWVLQ